MADTADFKTMYAMLKVHSANQAKEIEILKERLSTPPADAALADALEHAGTRAEFHPDSEIAVLCSKAAAALRARAVPVDDICNAYESGVGHNGRATANVNPYPPGTPQHTAYELRGEEMSEIIAAGNQLSWPGAFAIVGFCACLAYAITH